ncbi:uncharacterized protein LOC135365867 [Ornithodoros turicata]|uniref:uncharacterized protein LOC135365867 n=1 Tax=Ornithodoros turicata TaxID=34597 RepID=UPI003139B086
MEPHFGWPKQDEVFRELQKIRRKEGYHVIFETPRTGKILQPFPQATTGFYVSLLFYHATDNPSMDVKYFNQKDAGNCYISAVVSNGKRLRCLCSKSQSDTRSDKQSGGLVLTKGDYTLLQFHMSGNEGRIFMNAYSFLLHVFDDRRLDCIQVDLSDTAPLQEFHVTQDNVGFPSPYFPTDSSLLALPGTMAYVQVGSVTTVTGRPDSSGDPASVKLSNPNFERTLYLGFPPQGQFNITVRILATSAVLDASFVKRPSVLESSDSMKETDIYFLNVEILNMIHECGIGND